MISAINSALSGLSAATQRLNVSAANIANADSTGTVQADGTVSNTPYVPQQVIQSSLPDGGVNTTVASVTPATIPVNDAATGAVTQYPNVDPAQQLIQSQIASYDAQGNINVLKVQNKLFQSVLNIVS